MNKDGFKGAGNQVAGEVKRQYGKATNQPITELEGNAQKLKGKVQSAFADAKDEANS
jgi:uncharacterized protein YjbJ (UPF0337 family)